MALGGSTGPAPEDPDLSARLADFRRAWASAPADPVSPEEAWVRTDADLGAPEIQVGLSEDTQVKLVWQSIDLTRGFFFRFFFSFNIMELTLKTKLSALEFGLHHYSVSRICREAGSKIKCK